MPLYNPIAAGTASGSPLQQLYAEISVDTTTTSVTPTFVDLLTVSITTSAGSSLLMNFTAGASNTNNNKNVYFRLTVDGTTYGGSAGSAAAGALNADACSIQKKLSGLSAGSHTVKIQWAVDANTGQVRPVTVPNSEHAALLVTEVV